MSLRLLKINSRFVPKNWPWKKGGVISVCIFILKLFTFSMFDIWHFNQCIFSCFTSYTLSNYMKRENVYQSQAKKNWAAIGGTFQTFKKWKLVGNYFKHFFEGETKLKHLLRLHNLYSQDHFILHSSLRKVKLWRIPFWIFLEIFFKYSPFKKVLLINFPHGCIISLKS